MVSKLEGWEHTHPALPSRPAHTALLSRPMDPPRPHPVPHPPGPPPSSFRRRQKRFSEALWQVASAPPLRLAVADAAENEFLEAPRLCVIVYGDRVSSAFLRGVPPAGWLAGACMPGRRQHCAPARPWGGVTCACRLPSESCLPCVVRLLAVCVSGSV